MTLILKTSNEETIALPAWLMKLLILHEGDQIKVIIEGVNIRLTPINQFLSLQGVLKDDGDSDKAIDSLNQGWQS